LRCHGIVKNKFMRQTATESILRLYWPTYLTNKYCYPLCSSVVTYLYMKRDKGHIMCNVYWKWLYWNTRLFVCLLNLVTYYLSPIYKPAYEIFLATMIKDGQLFALYTYIYTYIHTYIHTYTSTRAQTHIII